MIKHTGRGNKNDTVDKALNHAMENMPVISQDLNKDNVFLLYATFCGDEHRTAAAASITVPEVLELASQGKWNEKLKGIIELKKSGRAGDVERAINRAINFVQAHKYRSFLERVIQHICSQPVDELEAWMFSFTYLKDNPDPIKKLSTRPFADLAAALEKCQALTYLALGDTTSERKGRDEQPDADLSGGELHARIAAAMSKEAKVIAKVL